MEVKRRGGMTEFIPTPKEKREAVLRDHVLELLENLHRRVAALEEKEKMTGEAAVSFARIIEKIRREEGEIAARFNPVEE